MIFVSGVINIFKIITFYVFHFIILILERKEEMRTLLNNILRRKANWFGHILRRNCILHDATDGQMTEVKRVGRRRTQLLDDLRNRRRYWELKEEAEDRKIWKRQFNWT